MTYQTRLSPWCIVRLLPKMQRIVVCRCRKRNEALDHMQALKRLNAEAIYEIIFDPGD